MWVHRLELLTTQWCGTGSLGVQFLAGWSTSSNRYISASFENGIVNRRTFDVVKAIEPNVEHISLDFFVHHADLVENGTIPNALKSLLVAGVCV